MLIKLGWQKFFPLLSSMALFLKKRRRSEDARGEGERERERERGETTKKCFSAPAARHMHTEWREGGCFSIAIEGNGEQNRGEAGYV